MIALAFDTSTDLLSVAAATDTAQIHIGRRGGLRHGSRLAPTIQRCLDELEVSAAELDWVACTRGPGSFTGLRIGMATAKGLATGLGRMCVVSVPTLEAIAATASWPGIVVPLIDARKQRVYAAAFRGSQRLTDDMDIDPRQLAAELESLRSGDEPPPLLCGADALALADRFPPEYECERLPHGVAPVLLALAAGRGARGEYDPPDLGPQYLRGADARRADQ